MAKVKDHFMDQIEENVNPDEIRNDEPPENGWLVDNGTMALGYSKGCQGFKFTTYTSGDAIRFARKEDAERMISYMKNVLGSPKNVLESLSAVDHQWG